MGSYISTEAKTITFNILEPLEEQKCPLCTESVCLLTINKHMVNHINLSKEDSFKEVDVNDLNM